MRYNWLLSHDVDSDDGHFWWWYCSANAGGDTVVKCGRWLLSHVVSWYSWWCCHRHHYLIHWFEAGFNHKPYPPHLPTYNSMMMTHINHLPHNGWYKTIISNTKSFSRTPSSQDSYCSWMRNWNMGTVPDRKNAYPKIVQLGLDVNIATKIRNNML